MFVISNIDEIPVYNVGSVYVTEQAFDPEFNENKI